MDCISTRRQAVPASGFDEVAVSCPDDIDLKNRVVPRTRTKYIRFFFGIKSPHRIIISNPEINRAAAITVPAITFSCVKIMNII
jgi:hypothetical protein